MVLNLNYKQLLKLLKTTNILLNMLKHRLLFAATAIATAFNAMADVHTDYIQSGDLGYNVTYDDNGPVSAQVYRYAGENWRLRIFQY